MANRILIVNKFYYSRGGDCIYTMNLERMLQQHGYEVAVFSMQYPENEDGAVFGIAVHDFIAKYVDKLIDGSIPYEKMDRRIFRLIWEHKKVMLERIKLIEDALSLDHFLSDAYTSVVREADNCRMLYAAHHMKQRNSVLPTIQKKLLSLKLKEKGILEKLIEATKGDNKK